MDISELSPDDIQKMSYNELIGVVQETNRPPGGLRSIQEIALRTFLGPGKRVLEIGTSTGVTAVELALMTQASITAIDINPTSLDVATRRAARHGVSHFVSFEVQDATHLGYADCTFDLVFCGNVTSLVADRRRALEEYMRVLKAGGVLAAVPMYYVRSPPDHLVRQVSEAIQVPITPLYKDDWTRFFQIESLTPFWSEDYVFDELPATAVDAHADLLLAQAHLKGLRRETYDALKSTYAQYMQLFRVNLSHMGFTILLLRKGVAWVDPELFTSHRV